MGQTQNKLDATPHTVQLTSIFQTPTPPACNSLDLSKQSRDGDIIRNIFSDLTKL